MMSTVIRWFALAATVAPCALGCATTTPAVLVDARQAYGVALQADAERWAKAELTDAREALDVAERTFEGRAKKAVVEDMAVRALNKARLAEEHAIANKKANDEAAAEARRNKRRDLTEELAKLPELTPTVSPKIQAERQARELMNELRPLAKVELDEKRGLVMLLPTDGVFRAGNAKIQQTAKGNLEKIAKVLKEGKDQVITIEVYTDGRGTPATNLSKSLKRAQAMRDFFVEAGLEKERIYVVGFGKERPLGDNQTAEGRAKNRRMEIVIHPIEMVE